MCCVVVQNETMEKRVGVSACATREQNIVGLLYPVRLSVGSKFQEYVGGLCSCKG